VHAATTGNPYGAVNIEGALKLVGDGPQAVALASLAVSATADVTGVSVVGQTTFAASSGITLHAARCLFRRVDVYFVGGGLSTVTIDASDLGAGSTDGTALSITPSSPAAFVLTNSYVHGGAYGASAVTGPGFGTVPVDLAFRNDTFVGSQVGLYAFASGGFWNLTYTNNVITSASQYGVDLANFDVSHITSKKNSLFANGANYNGQAIPGSDLTSDPKLSTATPPRPGAGSSLLGAADPASATPFDFFGKARAASPTIGAVEP
jgi:hypothetical protein